MGEGMQRLAPCLGSCGSRRGSLHLHQHALPAHPLLLACGIPRRLRLPVHLNDPPPSPARCISRPALPRAASRHGAAGGRDHAEEGVPRQQHRALALPQALLTQPPHREDARVLCAGRPAAVRRGAGAARGAAQRAQSERSAAPGVAPPPPRTLLHLREREGAASSPFLPRTHTVAALPPPACTCLLPAAPPPPPPPSRPTPTHHHPTTHHDFRPSRARTSPSRSSATASPSSSSTTRPRRLPRSGACTGVSMHRRRGLGLGWGAGVWAGGGGEALPCPGGSSGGGCLTHFASLPHLLPHPPCCRLCRLPPGSSGQGPHHAPAGRGGGAREAGKGWGAGKRACSPPRRSGRR